MAEVPMVNSQAFAPMRMLVRATRLEASGILSYELGAADGSSLPSFTAGSHLDLSLPNGMLRSYSLINATDDHRRYVIAVQKARASRGGSAWIHANLHAGDVVNICALRNNFPLNEKAEQSIFIAGGIGITPILGMARRLTSIGRPWTLHYCCRTRESAAFVDELQGRAQLNFDGEPGGRILDIHTIVDAAEPDAHLYCCGPAPMLASFEAATAQRPSTHVHVEYFTNATAAAVKGGFTVVLARTGREIFVLPNKSILNTLLEAGVDVPHSCTEGVCGTCEVKVLEGEPDHRDSILTSGQHASNSVMLICCSGAKSDRLVLDI